MSESIYQILMRIEGNEKVKENLEEVGRAAGLAGAALLAFSGFAAKSAMEYNQSMAAISTVSTEATGSTEQLSQQFGELSTELNGMLSKQEAATAFYDILSSGFSENADALGILTQSQKAATAGFSDVGTVSTVVAASINAYGDTLTNANTVTEKAVLVTDMLLTMQDNGVIKVGEYAQSIGQLIPIARASGTTIEEMNGAITTATLNTVPAAQAITGLRQVISNLQTPTAEAEAEAERLGVAFGPAALKAKGLEGMLRELTDAGGITTESIGLLFGSVEAQTVALAIAGENMDQFSQQVENMGDSAGRTQTNFETMTDTDLSRFQGAVTQLNNAIIDMGQGVMVGLTPIISILAKAGAAFSSLDPELKAVIGQVIALTGVVLTLQGGLLILVATTGGFIKSLKTSYGVMGTLLTKLTGISAAQLKLATANVLAAKTTAGFAAASKTLALTLAPMVATVALLSAAVGVLVLNYQYWQNLKDEQKNIEMQGQLQETELLAEKISTLSIRMRESGEAIPQDEWDRWITMLKDADNGTLTPNIAALERQRAALVEGAAATDASTEANGELAKSNEELTAELDERSSVIEATAAAEIEMIQATAETEEEAITQIAAVRQRALAERLAIEKQKLSMLDASTTEHAMVSAKIMSLEAQQIQVAKDATEALEAEQQKRVDDKRKALDAEIMMVQAKRSQLDASRAMGDVGGLDYIAQTQGYIEEELTLRRAGVEEAIAITEEGTIERARLELELTQINLELVTSRVDAERQAIDEISNLNEAKLATERAFLEEQRVRNDISDEAYIAQSQAFNKRQLEVTRDRIRAEIEYTAEGTAERALLEQELAEAQLQLAVDTTAAIKEQLDLRLEDLKVNVQAQISELQAVVDVNQTIQGQSAATSSHLSSLDGVLGDIISKLEDENISAQERRNLNHIAREVVGDLRDLGIDIADAADVTKALEEARLEIAAVQIQLKIEELKIEREITDLKREQNRLEQGGIIETENLRQESGTLTDNEMAQSQLKERSAEQTLNLIDREEAISNRSFDLQETSLRLQERVATATPGINGLNQRELDRVSGNPVQALETVSPSAAPSANKDAVVPQSAPSGMVPISSQSGSMAAGGNQVAQNGPMAAAGGNLVAQSYPTIEGPLGSVEGLLKGILQAVQSTPAPAPQAPAPGAPQAAGAPPADQGMTFVNAADPCTTAIAVQESRLKAVSRQV